VEIPQGGVMACCDWETFKQGLTVAFAERAVPSSLIDWKRAKRDWSRHHCTGAESAIMQIAAINREGEYAYLSYPRVR
jgi:hypothetical protein